MTQQTLNQCMILHVHHQKTDDLILTDFTKEFVNRNERRQNFFGQYYLVIFIIKFDKSL